MTRSVHLLPGRPPDGDAHGPVPGAGKRAVCCSGGGIRAAAFCLGGLQGLGRRRGTTGRSWYDDVDLVTAVSGGSYMAASFAMVNHRPPAHGGFDRVPVYAPGSAEDNRLRAHTRYLVEDKQAAAVGVLGIVYGLVLNLLPILAGLFFVGTLLGWVLRATRLMQLNATKTAWEPRHVPLTTTGIAGLAGLGLLCFALDRWLELHLARRRDSHPLRRVCLGLLGLSITLVLLLVAIPALLSALSTAGTSGRVGSVSGTQVTTGLVGTSTALIGLIKATLGRFRGRLQATSTAGGGKVTSVLAKTARTLAPWAGSALAAALLVAAFLVWVNNATYRGPTAGGWLLVAAAAAGMCLWQLSTDINRSSIHPYYKSRLATAFAVQRSADGEQAEQQPADPPIRFSSYAEDRPTLVVCAAVNTDQAGTVPAGRGCAPFTFSPHWVGISSGTMFRGMAGTAPVTNEPGDPETQAWPSRIVGSGATMVDRPRLMLPTTEYEELAGVRLLDLPAAVAVSGAAVSPVMGRMTKAPLRMLLGLANVRLGLWLPNPLDPRAMRMPGTAAERDRSWQARLRWQWHQPGLRALLAEILGGMGLDGRWIYVTDGGHYENLGLVEALRRGATEIVVLDASGDPPNSWATFGEAIETARSDLGVEISLNPSRVMQAAAATGFAPTLAAQGAFRYPNGVTGTLVLCKLAMSDDVSWDVHAWGRSHPEFPHDSTAQQLYGDREFEAYRRLGESAAEMALKLLDAAAAADAAATAGAAAPTAGAAAPTTVTLPSPAEPAVDAPVGTAARQG